MPSNNTTFSAPLIKEKGATLQEINSYVSDLGIFCKNLKSVVITDSSFDATLQAQLNAGVTNILSGIGANYRMIVDVANAYVAFKEKDANHLASVGAYSGTLRTGLIVDANGIAMGYNRKADGNWQTTIAADGTTGNLTVLGTLLANSVITSSVTLSGSGNALSTLDARSYNGQVAYEGLTTNVTTILKGVLQPNTTGAIAVGTITWNSGTGALTGGSGIAITQAGIIGANSGVAKFILDTSGNAFFGGDINTAGQFIGTGSYTFSGFTASIIGKPADTSKVGVYGISVTGNGIEGQSQSSVGVRGTVTNSGGYGVTGSALNASSVGIGAWNTSTSGVALEIIQGILKITSGTLQIDSNLMTKTRVNGHTVSIYDATTHAFIATYEYDFA
jgi:hypothetical protein